MESIPRPVTIVMVEDDQGHATLIERNLRRAGVHNKLHHFISGNEAVSFLFAPENAGGPLLVLLDLNLPDMSGLDILARLKDHEALRRMPVIVLTTTDDKVEIQKVYDLGANVYITKPVNYETFAQAIRQLGLFLSVIEVPETP